MLDFRYISRILEKYRDKMELLEHPLLHKLSYVTSLF